MRVREHIGSGGYSNHGNPSIKGIKVQTEVSAPSFLPLPASGEGCTIDQVHAQVDVSAEAGADLRESQRRRKG
jgi:hypothetical protein